MIMAALSTNDDPEPISISVCVCTYKRPKLLARLLKDLEVQETDGILDISVIVVDNDMARSAQALVEDNKHTSRLNLDYYVVEEQNISLARNCAVKNASSEYIAFIDDDEYPGKRWLLDLLQAIKDYDADGALGPVLPDFEVEPPSWIVKGRLLERKTFATGTILKDARHTRTGNVMLKKELFRSESQPFNPKFGRTGGEDTDFFRRKLEEGGRFVWCNEAKVFEHVPPERATRHYLLKRALLRGEINSKGLSPISLSMIKSITAITLYTIILPFLMLLGQDYFMKFLIKECDHLGKVFGVLGIRFQKTRNF